ncbi:hypothetical protein LIR51_02620 [Blautia producta]|uniref:hypothetical protein n=1 Tax=Blautia producta TaxID=33035 RepID=UPI001D005090|nr:hypothetical protein [Blautia producta]MCB5873727.1 hypothetical protein [Blautia producta]
MSHFNVAVFTEQGQDMDTVMEPFSVAHDVEPYISLTKEEVITKVKNRIADIETCYYKEYLISPESFCRIHCRQIEFLNFITKEFEEQLKWSDEQCYQYGVEIYEPEEIDENGNFLSTYNPHAKWASYEIGGDWENQLAVMRAGKMQFCNSAKVSEVVFPDGFSTFALLFPDGTWYEMGQMRSFGIVENEREDWTLTFKELLDKAAPDWILTIVDCNI